jgi:hypothetical protein
MWDVRFEIWDGRSNLDLESKGDQEKRMRYS